MSLDAKLDQLFYKVNQSRDRRTAPLDKFTSEVEFAKRFAGLFEDKKSEWEGLILKATEHVSEAFSSPNGIDVEKVISEAEAILAPIGKVAKEYTMHCAGHAHIDMNWMWPWHETVNVSHDTFATVDKLMEEFPEFRFSQSQASTYVAMQEYCPEVFELIKKRVKEKKWDVTASMWVEGDKNIVSGESLCRHLLYTRKYFKENFDLNPEDVKIDWSPDTFGHAHTLPSILTRGGVTRYYHTRTGPGPWLFKWRSPDKSEILVYTDHGGYNGVIEPKHMTNMFIKYTEATKLHDFMFLYGVGDHGGGPTRKDLRKAREMNQWPIYPVVKLSTTDEFYTAVEPFMDQFPVIDRDLNFVFEGCYTSQSNIKKATRVSEIIIPETETMAVIAKAVDNMEYPTDLLFKSWRHTLFNHFHDILPGSGIHATYEYSQGLFQEIQAMTGAIRTRAMRRLVNKVNTASAALAKESTFGSGFGDGFGAGAGDNSFPGGITARNAGAAYAEPILIFNNKPWGRSETVYAKVWNKALKDDSVVVRDSNGKEIKGQVIGRGHYWGHDFTSVVFRAENVPALGYKVYAIDSTPAPVAGEGVKLSRSDEYDPASSTPFVTDGDTLENEYLKVVVDSTSGAVSHLIDKETGFDYVPEGKLLGLLEACMEAPHGMTAWVIGQVNKITPMNSGKALSAGQRGPNRASLKIDHNYNNSTIAVEVGLSAGSKKVEFKVNTRWVEIGDHTVGIPMLRAAFPMNTTNGVPTYEIPFGSQKRAQGTQEIPALKWADISGETSMGAQGFTLVNENKYGHSCNEDILRLTLLRSSNEPDPLPEVMDHEIKFAVIPHKGECDVIAAIRAGEEYNSPLAVVSAPVQEGDMPAEKSFVEVLTPNVFVTTVKKAEDSDALIIRMFESEGKDTTAKVKISDLVKAGAKAVETDVLERPIDKNTAKMNGDTLTVTVPAFGQATVKIG